MGVAYWVVVAQCLAPQLGGEVGGEVLEFAQLGADFYGPIFIAGLVEEDGEEGLRAACVLDCLGGEPDRVGVGGVGGEGGEVEVAVEGFVFLRLLARRVFEEEDDADGVEGLEGLRVEGDEFLELDVLDAQAFD